MKLGIVGSGMIVQDFLPHLIQIEDLEIVALVSTKRSFLKAQELCKQYGIKNACDDFDALKQFDIDTIYIALPNHLHYMYAKKALENGYHVILEKPFTSTIEEALELKEIAKEKNLFIFEAITTLHFDTYHQIKNWLNRIGKVKNVMMKFSQYSSRYDAFKNGDIAPVFDVNKAGGALMDLNIYNVHFVMGLFGKPKDSKYYAHKEKDIDTSGTILLLYEDFTAVCFAAKDASGPALFTIEGNEGYITITNTPNLIGEIILTMRNGEIERIKEEYCEARCVMEFKRFIEAIKNHDEEFYQHYLNKSLEVLDVLTKVRREEGIYFPNDKEKLS